MTFGEGLLPEPQEAVLVFREQEDGRLLGRLPGGKVAIVLESHAEQIEDGQRWKVKLRHRETFAIAEPLERVSEPVRPAPATDTTTAVTALQPDVSTRRTSRVEPGRILRASDRVAFFVDGANMDGACRHARYFLDYRKAKDYFSGDCLFNAAFYYVADFVSEDNAQQPFLDFLSHAGFIVRRKPVKVIRDEDTGERIIKGNLDTEIVLDMLNTAGNYDVAFLFSGDSDFERAIDLLRSHGKRIYLVTSRRALSRELAYIADKPIFFLEEYQDKLGREDRKPGMAH